MSFFKRFFGRKTDLPKPVDPSGPAPTKNDSDAIRAFDAYGREVFINREEWRTQILPANLRKVWDQPDDLYQMILSALNDGFRSDVVDAARRLQEIDPNHTRSTCILGIVLIEEGQLKEAEEVFTEHTLRHGEEGVVFANLAKLHATRKQDSKAESVLWRALELDPNQEFGVSWFEQMHRDKSGPGAASEALRRVAALPGSWRAQLWLARLSLEARDLEQAMSLYRESLSRVSSPTPSGLLMQMSGDLGNHGHLCELLDLTEPRFEIRAHGLQVGNNLIKAHLDLGQVDDARILVDRLYALQRPDWRDTLSYWDTEIARTRISTSPVESTGKLQMEMLVVEGPIWLRATSPAAELFPAKIGEGPRVSFLGCSASMPSTTQKVQHQLSDATGRMSRALPLFLAEEVEFATNARVQTLVPWVIAETGGFVLCGETWSDEDAAAYARQGANPSDYVVVTHLHAIAEPWKLELRLVRTIDAQQLGMIETAIDTTKPETHLPTFARALQALLRTHAGVEAQDRPDSYFIPNDKNFSYYLLRLEQLLAVRCSAMDGIRAGFLSGERDIIDGNIQLCLQWPASLPARLLLAQTILVMRRVRPEVVKEFRDKLSLLQEEQPLSEPAHSVIERMVHDALG